MALVTMLLRGEFRHRWRSWLAGALLVALVSGLVLAGVATARRTATAFPRFEAAHGFDAFFYSPQPAPKAIELPEVTSAEATQTPAVGPPPCACSHAINLTDFSVNKVPVAQQARMSKLVAGRFPNPSEPNEVLASFTMQRDLGVHVGSLFHVTMASPAQRNAVLENQDITPAGPTLALRVVGIEASEFEFPVAATPSYDLFTTPAFARTYNDRTFVFYQYFVALRHGAASLPRFEAEARSLGGLSVTDLDSLGSTISSSISPQAVGWWILTGLTGLFGVIVLFQALLRQALVESEIDPTLSALGASRRQRIALVMARTTLMAAAGVAIGLGLATLLSLFTPVGEARVADPSPGLSFDPLLLVPGACIAFGVVLALGVWPAIRATRLGSQAATVPRPSKTADLFSSWGAPPSVLIGVRYALERGRGRSAVPAGSALLGAILAVTALSANAVFGGSLSHLTRSPVLYGQAFDAWFPFNQTGGSSQNEALAVAAEHPGITAATIGIGGDVEINGRVVAALAGQSLRGPLLITVTKGRPPAASDEVALGSRTMRSLGVHVGSSVRVTSPASGGGIRTGMFRVVGSAVFPPDFTGPGLGTGAVFPLASLAGTPCRPGPAARVCQIGAVASAGGAVLVRAAPGQGGDAALAALTKRYPSQVNFPVPPTNLVNFGEAVNFR